MNRFVKDNLVLFIVMGGMIIVALILLALAVLGHARMFRYHAEAEELRNQIGQLVKQTPAPVEGNVAPMRNAIDFYKEKTAEILPRFGQIREPALNVFIKTLGVDKQKFLETFRAAWENDEDRKAPGGRRRFYERFSQGLSVDNNWAADLKLTPAACLNRWQDAVAAFREEYQKLTVEVIDESNQTDVLLAVLGVPRNYDGDPEACMQRFIVPLAQRLQEICAKPPLTAAEEKDQAERKKKAEANGEEDDIVLNKVELLNDSGSFGFNLKVNPRAENIVDIVKNGEVIGDLVRRIATAKVGSINSFIIRQNNYAGEKIGRYVIYHYTFSVTGNIAKVRNLVQMLNNAAAENRMYIVRSVFLYADVDGAGRLMQDRQDELARLREELDAAGAASEANNNTPGMPRETGRRRRGAAMPMDMGMPGMPGMPGMMEGPDGKRVQVKTAEQIRKEEMAKPYDKREGYGKLLFGGSPVCEAVFDVEYVYLAEPELE